MNIKLMNLPEEYKLIKDEIDKCLLKVISEGRFINSKEIRIFESKFADYSNSKYCVGVASGTAAIFLTLKALGIGKGDEVITTTLSFNATAEAIALTGAKPVFVDVKYENLSIDENLITKKITRNTKAILPVHLYGIPANLKVIKEICNKNNLLLIEDCAQAQGSYYENKHVGSFGAAGCFSFMPAKNLGSYGDAGCIVTNNKDVANKLITLRDHGRRKKYEHILLGYAERMDNIQATVLLTKIKYLKKWNDQRKAIAQTYDKTIDKSKIKIIDQDYRGACNFYTYPIRVKNRDKLQVILKSKGIETNIYYPIPMHLQKCFTYLKYNYKLPVAENESKKLLSIPINPFLNIKEIEYIVTNLNKYA